MDDLRYVCEDDLGWQHAKGKHLDVVDARPVLGPTAKLQPDFFSSRKVEYVSPQSASLEWDQRLYVVLRKAAQSDDIARWALLAAEFMTERTTILREQYFPFLSFKGWPHLKHADFLEEINALREMPLGWAGPESVPPSSNAIEIAAKLVTSLPGDIPAPQVTVSGDGDIGLVWVAAGNKIEALLDQDATLAWVAKVPPERDSGAEAWRGQTPAKLLEWLRIAHK